MKQVTTYFFLLIFFVQIISAQKTFHGNNARTGVYETAELRQFSRVKWSFKTQGPILSSPAISDGVVFIGSADNHLYAVDQKTGQQKWKFKTGGHIASSPAVADGIVYFGSYDGGFYALDKNTGTLKWRFAVDYEKRFEAKGIHGLTPKNQMIPDAWDVFTSSPAVFNNRVYFGSGDGNVYALDSQTGALKWKFKTGDVVHTSPAIADNTIYIGSWDSNLYALDAETGKEKWRFEAGRDPENNNQTGFTSSPAIVDGTIYVGCRDAHVYAIDAATGKKKWDFYTDRGWVTTTPAVRDGVVYAGTGSTLEIVALNAQTGLPKFRFDMKTGVFSSPALAGDMLYVGNTNGRLHAIDIKSGKQVWEFQTESSKRNLLNVLNPDGSFNDSLTAFTFFDFQDRVIWMYKRYSVGAIKSSPVVDNGEVYFGSADGFLYALQ